MRGAFHDAAEIHDQHPVGEIAHDREIVGDEQVGQAKVALEIDQQVQDLRLDRHVERRHRLVAHDQRRPQDERTGDADPLALAAGEFVRIAVERIGRQADAADDLRHVPFALGAVTQPVHLERRVEKAADGLARIERAEGILEDHLHAPAVHSQRPVAQTGDVGAVERHGSLGGGHQPQDGLAERGLAAARFAHQPDRLAALDVERHAIDRAQHLPANGVARVEVPNGEQRHAALRLPGTGGR